MTAQLVLGTAQLGSAYGVNNSVGKPSFSQAASVLNAAVENHVRLVDTAEGYGDSERFIGEYRRSHGDAFGVCTKLSVSDGRESITGRDLRKRVQAAAVRLFSPSFFIYYLHAFEMCRDEGLLDALVAEREDGAMLHVGVSVYEPSELRFVLDYAAGAIDAVQIPLNVFNCSGWFAEGLLQRAKEEGVLLLARSIYLQGLVFKAPDDPMVLNLGLGGAISGFRALADDAGWDAANLAASFVLGGSGVDYVVLGSETPEQVRGNARLLRGAVEPRADVVERILGMSERLDPVRLDPRTWNGGGLCVITARGGSKRIPRKNIREFCGKPIIAYSIEAALESGLFDEVMVSTDDEEIAGVARLYGAKVPFMRSGDSSGDHATTRDVLLEVLSEYERLGVRPDVLCCVYPTAPFVTAEKLRRAHDLLSEGASQVVPVVAFSFPPQRGLVLRDGRLELAQPECFWSRSQDLEAVYHDCGQFYFYRVQAFLRGAPLLEGEAVPMVLPETEVQDIDNEVDWAIAEMKYRLMVEGDKNDVEA